MKEVGRQLKEIREEKEISLEDVQNATKIRAGYIAALENGDLDALPGRVYGMGFAATYAKFLGLEESEIVAIYKTYYDDTEANRNVKKAEAVKDNKAKNFIRNGGIEKIERKDLNYEGQAINVRQTTFGARFSWLVLFLIVVILGIMHYNLVAVAKADADKVSLVELASSETVNNNIIDANSIEYDENDNVVVKISVKENAGQPCWINVILDSKEYLTTKVDIGKSVILSADEQISVQYSNAKSVELVVNGVMAGVVDEMQDSITEVYTKDGIISEKIN